MNSDKFIKETFLKLTSKTYPHGYEDDLARDMIKNGLFPADIQQDKDENYFYKIGESRTIFASHLDTVSAKHTKVNHVFDGKLIKTDGTTTLGADDKAGVTIMLWMIKNKIPGLYYFFIGEEVGCIGSGLASKRVFDFKGRYDRILSFDRRGTNSIITHQSFTRSCSDEFADSLASELNKGGVMDYIKDDGGVYTDSAEFTGIIAECTNISVGYYKEHSVSESQDIDHLQKLATACLSVDWENLVTSRDMNAVEYKEYKSTASTYGSSYGASYGSTSKNWRNRGGSWNCWDGYTKKSSKKFKDYEDWYDDDDYYGSPADDYDDEEEEDGYDGYDLKGRTTYIGDDDSFSSAKVTYNSDGSIRLDSDGKKTEVFNTNTSHYSWVLSKFGEKLTVEELEVISTQYLDIANNENDKSFYDYLINYISDDDL